MREPSDPVEGRYRQDEPLEGEGGDEEVEDVQAEAQDPALLAADSLFDKKKYGAAVPARTLRCSFVALSGVR